jgi:hypothetical protein
MAGPSAGSRQALRLRPSVRLGGVSEQASPIEGEGWGGESVDRAVDNLAGDVDNRAAGEEKRAVGVEKGT